MKTHSKVFIDTNVLIYGVDVSDPVKQAEARRAVNELHSNGNGVVSTQVLKEFFNASTKKLRLAPLESKRLTLTLTDFEVVSTTPDLVEQAMDLSILHSLSLWDALIVAAARQAKCSKVLSEDMQHRSSIGGVLVESPFSRSEGET